MNNTKYLRIGRKKIVVYQIVYDAVSNAALVPGCTPLVLSQPDRFLENRAIAQVSVSEELLDVDYVGFFSWNFFRKIPLSLWEILQLCDADQYAHDLYSFFGLIEDTHLWRTAEAKHPQILPAAQMLFDKLGLAINARELVAPAIYQNCFLCRPQLLRSYCAELLLPAIELMEADAELGQALSVHADYEPWADGIEIISELFSQQGPTLHPFVCERLLSTWLTFTGKTSRLRQVWHGRFVEPRAMFADLEHQGMLIRRDAAKPTSVSNDQGQYGYKAALIVTTYGRESWYTQLCLQRIAEWKDPDQQLIVVYHDATPLLRVYLEYLDSIGMVDVLLRAAPNHGHIKGVNLAMLHVDAPYAFNVNIDVLVGPGVIAECLARLQSNPALGAIGWHYQWGCRHQGSHWLDDQLICAVRPEDRDIKCRVGDELNEYYADAITTSNWHTGRVFSAIGKKRLLLFNGSFFGVKTPLWRDLGGFDENKFPHEWADDHLCYGILEKGYGIGNLAEPYSDGSNPDFFLQTSELKWSGIEDPNRGRDQLNWATQIEHPRFLVDELKFLDLLFASRRRARVTVVAMDPLPTLNGNTAENIPYNELTRDYDIIILGQDAATSVPWKNYLEQLSRQGVLVIVPPQPVPREFHNQQRLGVFFADQSTETFRRGPI